MYTPDSKYMYLEFIEKKFEYKLGNYDPQVSLL